MCEELYRKVSDYRVAMSIIKSMLKSGIISDRDYSEIDTIIANTYGLNSDTIFSDIC